MLQGITAAPIKVLYISHESDSIGGAFFSLLNLINSVKDRIEPIVVIPGSGKACEELKNRGIKYYIVPFKPTYTNAHGLKKIIAFIPRLVFNSFVNYGAVKKIKKIIRDEKAILIHSNSAAIDIGQILAKQLNIKHIWHIREFLDLDFDINPVIGWNFFLKKINRADFVICVSKGVYERFKLNTKENALVLFNAVRAHNEVRLKQEKKEYILFCGRIIENKGIEEALKAFSVLHKKHPNYKMIVAGIVYKDYFQHLTHLINKLGIKNVVDFIGFQENINDLMADASCFLMCSKNEALGRVTIEAMFNGCPVIGHATGGTAEIINDNETGYLYHNFDELIEKLTYVVENKENVIRITKKAQLYVQNNFTEEKYSEKIIDLYEKLVQLNGSENALLSNSEKT